MTELGERRYSVGDVLEIVRELAEILVYLHGRTPPIVHRDIKPSNVVRDQDGRLHLVDFGSVRDVLRDSVGEGSTVAGTFGYMAPEQLVGDATPQSDLYALGALALHLISRTPPVALTTRRGELSLPGAEVLPPPVFRLINDLVAYDSAERIGSAEAVIQRIETIRMGGMTQAVPSETDWRYRVTTPVRGGWRAMSRLLWSERVVDVPVRLDADAVARMVRNTPDAGSVLTLLPARVDVTPGAPSRLSVTVSSVAVWLGAVVLSAMVSPVAFLGGALAYDWGGYGVLAVGVVWVLLLTVPNMLAMVFRRDKAERVVLGLVANAYDVVEEGAEVVAYAETAVAIPGLRWMLGRLRTEVSQTLREPGSPSEARRVLELTETTRGGESWLHRTTLEGDTVRTVVRHGWIAVAMVALCSLPVLGFGAWSVYEWVMLGFNSYLLVYALPVALFLCIPAAVTARFLLAVLVRLQLQRVRRFHTRLAGGLPEKSPSMLSTEPIKQHVGAADRVASERAQLKTQ